MGQELTKPGDDARISARVGSLHAGIERDHHLRDTLPLPIDPKTRKELEEYRRDLHGRMRGIGLSAADRQTAGKAIGIFLMGYLNARTVDTSATLAAYLAALSDMPLFAILDAIDDFKNRRVFDIDQTGARIPFTIDHAPSAPRLLDQVKKRCEPILEERGKVSRLLAVKQIAPPPPDPEMVKKLGGLMRNLADNMKHKREAERAQEWEKIRAEADEARARAARIVQEATSRRRADSHAG